MSSYHQSPRKWSGELLNVLTKAGYRTVDPKTGRGTVHLTRLQKEKSIQDVARIMFNMPASNALLGELRQQLEANGIPPLRDEADTKEEYERTLGFQNGLKKAQGPKAYPQGTVLGPNGRPIR